MKRITLTIKANEQGKYKTVEVLNQIKNLNKEIIFPSKDINKTSLSELRYEGMKCVKGVTDGITETWNNEHMEYMKREMTLVFE